MPAFPFCFMYYYFKTLLFLSLSVMNKYSFCQREKKQTYCQKVYSNMYYQTPVPGERENSGQEQIGLEMM